MTESGASRADLLAALNTDYFVLQGAAGASIESGSRSSLYVLTLSSALVSLGFVLGAARWRARISLRSDESIWSSMSSAVTSKRLPPGSSALAAP